MIENFGRRIGRFTIGRTVIEDTPEVALAVMRKVIVVRAEMMYAADTVEYVALSPDFQVVEGGCSAPEYRVIVTEIPTSGVGEDGSPAFDVAIYFELVQ